MSTPTTIPVIEKQDNYIPDLTPWLDKFDRREKLLVLLSLSTKIQDNNLEQTIFSAILDRLCNDDQLFCAFIVDAMFRQLSTKKCFKILKHLNHKLATDLMKKLKEGGSHE